MRRSSPDQWVISTRPAHEALVSEEQFVAVQSVRSPRPEQVHAYLYTGLLHCGECSRRMEGCWNNGAAAYRCRHGHSSASRLADRVPNAYVRETHLLARMPLLHTRLAERQATGKPGDQGTPRSTATARTTKVKDTSPTPEEVIDQLRRSAQTLTYYHPTRTLEVGGKLPIRITV